MNDEFKEMVLLYEELVRKETVAYCQANPHNVSGYNTLSELYGRPAANQTMKIIYGKDEANEFLKLYEACKNE